MEENSSSHIGNHSNIITLDSGFAGNFTLTSGCGLGSYSIYIGAANWGPPCIPPPGDVEGLCIGITSKLFVGPELDDNGNPPWPLLVAGGGGIAKWSAAFESIKSKSEGAVAPYLQADLLWASAPASSPAKLSQLDFTVVDTINLGEISQNGSFELHFGGKTLEKPFIFDENSYFLAHFYIASDEVANIHGFHAHASFVVI